jgi:hypothetical protein
MGGGEGQLFALSELTRFIHFFIGERLDER